MATITEIRQALVQGGLIPAQAQLAARILADTPPVNPPTGGIWDTLKARGYNVSQRYVGGVFRIVTDGTNSLVVISKNGIDTIYKEVAVESL